MSTVPSGLQRLRYELKRRKVYGTFAAYAVAVFGAWQEEDDDLRFRRPDHTWVRSIEETRLRLARLNRQQR